MDTVGILKQKTYNFFIKNYSNKETFKNKLKSFKKLMKENEELSNVYSLYSDLENKTITDTEVSKLFIDEAISEIKSQMNENFNKGIKKWSKIIGDIKLTENDKVSESIDILVYTKGPKSLLERIESKKNLQYHLKEQKEYITENETVVLPSLLNTVLVQKFNDKFNTMTESEKVLFKQINELPIDKIESEINSLKESINSKLISFSEDKKLEPLIDEVKLKLTETKINRISLYKLKMLLNDISN